MNEEKRVNDAGDYSSVAQTKESADVVIVGAGLSGLAAAYKLIEKDPQLKVIVLEAKDRVGGRTFGQKLVAASGFDTWDMGGQWIGSCQPDIMKLVEELELETYPQFTTGRKVMEFSDGHVRYYDSEIPSLSLFALIDLHLFMRKVVKMQRSINTSDPGLSEHAAEWDAMTAEEYKQKHLWTKEAKEALDAALRCMFGTEAVHISALYFLTYAASAGGLERLISAREKFGGQEFKVKGGAWQICSRLAERLPKRVLRLSTPVQSITQTQDSVAVVSTSGKAFNCRRVILAIPPHLIGQINFQPSLPLEKRHVFQRMPVGYLTKIIATYQTAFWRTAGLSGEVTTSGGSSVLASCDSGPLCIVFDATSSAGNPAIVSFIGGSQQIQYAGLTFRDRQRAVLHSLAKYFGPEALAPLDYFEKNWNEEPYNGGCPVSVGTPGMMTQLASALRQPFQCVHFAGTESATCWPGFLNGAVQSGYRAATEVLYNLRPQTVSASDLEGTAYDRRNPPKAATYRSKRSTWLRITVGLGILGAAATVLWKVRALHR